MDPLLPIEATRALAGAAGSLVFAFIAPDRESWIKALAKIFTGTVASFWLAPFLCEWREWKTPAEQHAVAFGLGLVGFICCKAVISAAESEAAQGAAASFVRAIKRAFGWPDDAGVK